MNHERIIDQDLIGRYRAGALAADDAEAFEAHLIGCAECQALLDSDLRLEQGLRTIAARAASATVPPAAIAAARWRLPKRSTLAAVAVLATVFAVPWLTSPLFEPAVPTAHAGLPVFQLALTRGPGDAVTELVVPAAVAWYALELEAPMSAGACCRVIIATTDGTTVWDGETAPAAGTGVVRVLLSRDLLANGRYRIALHALSAGAPRLVEHQVLLRFGP